MWNKCIHDLWDWRREKDGNKAVFWYTKKKKKSNKDLYRQATAC